MEVLHADLPDVFVQRRRQRHYILELIDCLKESSDRVTVQLFEFLAVDLDHFHIRVGTGSLRGVCLLSCGGCTALLEASSCVALTGTSHSLFETGDAAGDRLSSSKAELGRIGGVEHSHAVLQVLHVLLASIAGRPQAVQLIHHYGHHELA